MLTILLALAAAAPPISAAEFAARAEPLLHKSKVSLVFSSEARKLLSILGDVSQRTRARLEADRAAGKPVTTCLPPKGKASVDARELIAYLNGLAPAQKRQSFEAAFAGYAARKYPCR